MENLIKIFNIALENGLEINNILLFLIVIVSILCSVSMYIYFTVIKPLKIKIVKIPTKDDIKELKDDVKELKDELKNIDRSDKTEINNLSNKIDIMRINVQDLKDFNNNDLKEIKHELNHINQLLNQMHGHLLYDNNNNFGNREL